MITLEINCPNPNHRSVNAPVRFCPVCGEAVNADIPIRKCNEQEHTMSRRGSDRYCVHCGEQLIQVI